MVIFNHTLESTRKNTHKLTWRQLLEKVTTMNKLIMILLIIIGLINFIPVFGLISAAKITQAYSVELASNDLVILMRHRALLFGIIGGFILYSAFVPQYQVIAMIMAAVSMVGYLAVMGSVGGYNSSLFKVAVVDIVGIGLLVIVAILKYFETRS